MDFVRFIIRRVLFGIVVLWLVTLGTFFLFFVIPSNPAVTLAGKGGTPQKVAQIKQRLGLDQPVIVQYWHYLDRLLHGDLGTSFFTGAPVNGTIKSDLPPTLSLIIGGAVLWLIAGIGVGVLSATRARSLLDRSATLFVLIGISMPTFVVGLVLLFVVYFQLAKHGIQAFAPTYVPFTQSPAAWFDAHDPPLDHPGPRLRRPPTAGSPAGRCSTRSARTTSAPRARRACGTAGDLPAWAACRRSRPVVTQLGVDIGTLIGGAVVTESVFDLRRCRPGVCCGRSLRRRVRHPGDRHITAVAVVLANIVVDIAYSLLDPRVRLT